MISLWVRWLSIASIVSTIFIASPASAVYQQRYQSISSGAIVFTGNTLGLDRNGSNYSPGTSGSIGAFINSDSPNEYNGFGAYTIGRNGTSTTLWQSNKSEAFLSLPGGGNILYAELIWGGNVNVGNSNVSASKDVAVTFSTPAGNYSISPSSESLGNDNDAYIVRSANVTGIIQLAGQGRYAVGGVPAAYGNNANSHVAGWTLAVVYENPTFPTRNLSIFVGAEAGGASPAAVSGFCTPTSGLLKARALVTAMEGDAGITGDTFLFGPTSALGNGDRLSGPNNALTNFFGSQINNSNGALDTTGSFGTKNHSVNANGSSSEVNGARHGWDITSVDTSNNLTYNQTSAFAQGTTTGDQYTIAGLALQIDLSAPRFSTSGALSADKTTTFVGDEITYTVRLNNVGSAPADNAVVNSPVPPGMSFVSGSAVVNGVAKPSATLAAGISVGQVAANTIATVTYRLRVDTLPTSPANAQFEHTATWAYDYIACAGRTRELGLAAATAVVTPAVRLVGRKQVDPQGTVANGSVLTYTVIVENTGATPSSNTTLQDTLAAGTTYVANSTRMNGVVVADASGGAFPFATAQPIKSNGAGAGVIAPGASATIQFQATVVAPSLLIINTANYDVDGAGPSPSKAVTAVNSAFAPPRVSKLFNPNTVSTGQQTRLSITLTNDNALPINGVTFSDVMPPELSIAATPAVTTTCGGSVVANPGAIELSISGAAIPANGSCVIAVNVKTSASGVFENVIPIGAVQSTEANPNNVAGVATLTVREAPLVSKAFSPATVLINQASRLTITIVNPNDTPLTQVAMLDSLPSGLKVTTSPSTSSTCGGSLVAPSNATSISFSGGSIAANGICTLSVNVQAASPAVYRNIIPAGGVSSAGTESNSAAQADLTVAAIQVEKRFGTNPVAANTNSLMTITLINSAPTAITGVSFTDSFPNGMVRNGSASTSCTNGSTSITNTSVSLSNGTVPAGGSCTVTINVRSATAGSYTNTIPIGGVTTSNAGSNTLAAEATLSVAQPSVSKAFSPGVILSDQTSTLTITLSSPTSAITGVNLKDIFPAGLALSSPGGTCVGTKTVGVEASGEHFLRIANGTIPNAGSCTLTASVTGLHGVYTNVIAPGAVTTNGFGSNSEQAQANLVILAKPIVTKAFDLAGISPGTTTRLTVAVENPNALDMTSVIVTDVFPTSPGNMRVAAVPNENNACGGELLDSNGNSLGANDVGIRLNNAVVSAFSTCTFAVDVTATTPGTYSNVIAVNNISGVIDGISVAGASPASASVDVVVLPPLVEKVFTGSIATTQQAELVLRLSNPNPNAALTGVTLRDVFPTVPGNMTVASPIVRSVSGCGSSNATGTSGSVGRLYNHDGATLVAGSAGIRLSNATIAAGGSCEVRVNVAVTAAGGYINTTDAVTSTNGGTGESASGTLRVYAPPVLSKQFSPNEVAVNEKSRLTLSLFNSNADFAITGIAFTDTFPSGLTLAPTPNLVKTCTAGSQLTVSQGPGTPVNYSFSNGNLAANGVCTVSVDVVAAEIGEYTNTTSTVSTTNAGVGSAASAILTVKGYTLSGTVYDDKNANSVLDATDTALASALYVKLAVRQAGTCTSPALHVVQTTAAGTYDIVGVPDGEYCLLIDTSANNTDLTVTLPTDYATTESSGGLRVVQVAGVNQGQLNFGLFKGTRINGHVIVDNGNAGGTPHDGLRNGGELGLAGVQVVAAHASCSGGICGQAITDSDGAFELLLPLSGNLNALKIRESNLAAWLSVSGTVGNTGGSYSLATDELTFTATSGTNYSNIIFGDVERPSWLSDNQQSIRPDGVLFYPHIFTAKTTGTVTFSQLATATPAFPGWSQLIHRDSNCNGVLDGGEPVYALNTAIPVTAGQQVCVLLRQSVGSNASIGMRNSVTVSATFKYSGLPVNTATQLDNLDITTVSLLGNGLVLIKQVDKAQAKPGEELNYTITYRNSTDQPLENIEVRDVTPAYTKFISGGCNTPLPQSITSCSLSAFPAIGAAGDLVWTLSGVLQSNQEGSVRFRVKIDN